MHHCVCSHISVLYEFARFASPVDLSDMRFWSSMFYLSIKKSSIQALIAKCRSGHDMSGSGYKGCADTLET